VKPALKIISAGRAWFALALCLGLLGQLNAQTPDSIFEEDPATYSGPQIADPLEGFNRAMFKFNDGVYRVTLRPLSKGYVKVVPRPVRRGLGNFFHNLGFPVRFAGNVLEGKPKGAAVETGRFLINTLTSLGFAVTADEIPSLKETRSDLGQAFGTWGFGHGSFLVLPVVGPSSIRDGIGQALSGFYLDPVHYLSEWEYRAVTNGVRISNESPELMQAYDQLKSAALDPYIALRDAYSARRANRTISDTELPAVPAATSTVSQP
jgi:phospholipid-binding lipoprotein MlaA